MGNDHSVLSEYDIDGIPYAQIGLWTLHTAEKKNTLNGSDSDKVTVFTGKLRSYGVLTKEFERAIESLKTLRHPAILRYLSSCVAGDTVHLFVEYVTPLAQVLHRQTELEICSGLQNVLVALDFLHSKAGRVHNNVCKDAVFVSKSGEWKLGCFGLSCSFSEVNSAFLDEIRSSRYDKSVPPEDESKVGSSRPLAGSGSNTVISSRDVYGYGQLVKETIGKCLDSATVSDADIFFDLASKQMQNSNAASRPTTSVLSKHTFFNQPLLRAQDFLAEIAIKSPAEKDEFFRKLPELLYSIPETVVGSKLAKGLLSRMVVLNSTAQQLLLPHLLIPRSDLNEGLFDLENYRQYILPVVTRIFPVRDAQIRLLLLQYFPHFVGLLDRDHLLHAILPELLLGIKDTDDAVVAATLRSLADLVPMLGGAAVIGGTRLKLFTNGSPKKSVVDSSLPNARTSRSSESGKVLNLTESVPRKSSAIAVVASSLPERHEPDGGEDDASRRTSVLVGTEEDADDGVAQEEEDERWSDWEADEKSTEEDVLAAAPPSLLKDISIKTSPLKVEKTWPAAASKKTAPPRRPVALLDDDLSALDIQVKPKEDEIDYFADMQPTITNAAVNVAVSIQPTVTTPSLSFNVDDNKEADDGWNWDD